MLRTDDQLSAAIQLRKELQKAALAVERGRARVAAMRAKLQEAERALADDKKHLRLLTEHATRPEPPAGPIGATPDEPSSPGGY